MRDKLSAALNEYAILTKTNPVGYTRDVLSCVAGVFHRENSAVICHIEAYHDYINLDVLHEILNLKDDKILSADLFVGKLTNEKSLKQVADILDSKNIPYEISDVFRDLSNQTSIIYDYNTDKYSMIDYGHDMEIVMR